MSRFTKRLLGELKPAAEKKKQKDHKDAVTQPQRPHYGLYNQGATCYLNSVLQVLFMTTEIHDRLAPKLQFTDQELETIFKNLKERTCRTENISLSLRINNVNEQGDAAECLELILQKVNTRVSEVFQGQLTYTTTCSQGHSINEETNPFWTLPLSLTDDHYTTYSVESGFKRLIFQSQSFSGDNMVYCSECKEKTEVNTRCEMVKYPQILTLLLKRFDLDYNTMSHVKSDCCVDVPRVLHTENTKYELYGMVNHMGSLRGGHYTATVLCTEDKTWYEFDDDQVRKAEGQPFTETYSSSTAYLLMYRAQDHRYKSMHRTDSSNAPEKRSTLQQSPGPNEEDSREKQLLEEPKPAAEKEQKDHKDAVTHPQRPHYGLYRQGAVCCLNSVLQVLFVTTEIHSRLEPNSRTDQELRNIFEKLKETTCGTENLSQSLEIKNVNQQRDAAECLGLILRKVSPQVSEVFRGQRTYRTKCSNCHSINEEKNPFWTLPLSLKDAHDTTYSVKRGFERIFQPKSCSGDNMVNCSKCKKKTRATSVREMVELPLNLILHLKRFDLDDSTMSHVKSDCCVEVPRTLKTKNKKYKLYGMVNQTGSLRGGHYTATVLSTEDKTWYEFDDDNVKKVEEQPFAKKTYTSRTAYLLMYRGEDSSGKMNRSTKRLLEELKPAVKKKRQKDHKDAVTQPQSRHQGATCYLNSVLRVLFMTTEIHDRLDPESQDTDRELSNIFEELKETTCGAEKITQSLESKNVNQRRDAAECLEFILRKVSPQVSEVFQGQRTYTTKCSNCHSINEKKNPFWTLQLSLKDDHDTTYSVERGFKGALKSKSCSGDNMVYCSECTRKTKATSVRGMVEYPQILILHLKRFDFDDSTMSHVKSDHCVEVPCTLQTKSKKYKLYGMVNQIGSLRGGHYTATVLSTEDKTWYEFDDDNNKKTEGQPFAETYSSRTAYLLMYRATESLLAETGSEHLPDEVKDRQGEDVGLEELTGDKVEHKRNVSKRNSDATECQKPIKTASEDRTEEARVEVTLL